ncbi:MAG: carbohydrate kinase, partial [Flavihumibacter sp.]|nr:carbohydrate kinase [Flavihumibacter sp.]
MYPIPVHAVFDVGKTNKKLLLFDEQFNIVDESSHRFPEIQDESGFPCEDIVALKNWILNSLKSILLDGRYEVRAVNFSAYGASLVYLDQNGELLTPLYNYLKPFPDGMQEKIGRA